MTVDEDLLDEAQGEYDMACIERDMTRDLYLSFLRRIEIAYNGLPNDQRLQLH